MRLLAQPASFSLLGRRRPHLRSSSMLRALLRAGINRAGLAGAASALHTGAERIGLPGAAMIGSAAGSFYLWQAAERDVRSRRELFTEFDRRTFSRKHEDHHADMADRQNQPALWDGIVTDQVGHRERLIMQGPLILRNAREGEAVEVLHEEAGPGGAYVLCRRAEEVGLLPIPWVRRLEPSGA